MAGPAPVDHARRALARWRGMGLGPGVIVAVSGGSDSVALLRILRELGEEFGLALAVAHLDHGVRGATAEADARFVADLAGQLGLPFELGRWSPPRPAHFEADARRARYDWLVEAARRHGAAAVAVGHTQDDQAETILQRILRGTGPRGLAGIPARRRLAEGVDLIRPLREASRVSLRDYLGSIGQDWREDATNADTSRTRSRLRHELLPLLARDYNPRVVEALVRLGQIAATREPTFERLLREHERAAIVTAGPDAIVLRRERLVALPPALRVELLRSIWRHAGWPEGAMTAGLWRRLAAFARRGEGCRSVAGGISVIADADCLQFRRGPGDPPPPPPDDPVALPVPGSASWGDVTILAGLDPPAPTPERATGAGLTATGSRGLRPETIDLDAVDLDPRSPALLVRGPRDGDRFDPLGLDGHSMALNDFFRGRGIPRDERRRVPLVCDRSGIVWVVGHRIAHRARLRDSTRSRLGLRALPAPGDRDDPCG